ncbi:multiple sugar transport system permease protein [Streptacidiphilus sp. MAP12-16]|uniref:carbohydrate ABC transporter permease n=1 Tax=Streptacidiphilus sp. MAP12-16 TaxID=3156300 RepID=UPI003517E851
MSSAADVGLKPARTKKTGRSKSRQPSRLPVPRALRLRRRRELRVALAFLSPWLIGFAVFFLYPLVSTLYFSFMHYDGYNPPNFVGIKNWRYVFTEFPYFWPAVRNTLWLVVAMVTLRTVFGLGIGMLITKIKTGSGFFRTAFYLPYLAPPVAATIGFAFLLNPGTGPVNQILHTLGLPQPGWFTDPSWSKPSLVLLGLWGIGDLMVIFMASLLDVPTEQYEAASLDGAGPFQRFRYVTLPNIQPIIMFAVVTGVINMLQYYTQAIVAGQVASGVISGSGQNYIPGYPDNSTWTLPQLIYNLGFQNNDDIGSACVVSIILFVIAMAFTSLLMRRRSGLMGDD